MSSCRIASVEARPLNAPMSEPFEIAGGASTSVENVLVRVRLESGAEGWGEGAPLAAYNGETQRRTLEAAASAGDRLVGRDAAQWLPLLCDLERFLPKLGAARAAVGMAVLDAWTRARGLPLRALFGGAQRRLSTDVTVTIVPPEAARAAAARIRKLGVRTVKIKVGKDVAADEERVLAVVAVDRRFKLILDANQGYAPAQALRLLSRLKRRGVAPVLFEQPVAKDDWRGLTRVEASSGVPVAADESCSSREDALALARGRVCSVFNLKLMKAGLLEAWDIARIARAAGIRLMMGGNVESPLAMGAAAHFAAGLGGFSFVDLDTPLWFAKNPTRGLALGPRGTYDLGLVKSGIGVVPRSF